MDTLGSCSNNSSLLSIFSSLGLQSCNIALDFEMVTSYMTISTFLFETVDYPKSVKTETNGVWMPLWQDSEMHFFIPLMARNQYTLISLNSFASLSSGLMHTLEIKNYITTYI